MCRTELISILIPEEQARGRTRQAWMLAASYEAYALRLRLSGYIRC